MVVDRKNKKALALLYLGSGSLRNTANSSVVPTEFAAEPTAKTKPFSSSNFLPCTIKLSILSSFFFPFIDTFDDDGRHAISRPENAGCPKTPRGFPRFPAKERWHSPLPGCLGTPLPLPQSLYGRGTYADVTTRISRIDRLPNLLSNGAPLAR